MTLPRRRAPHLQLINRGAEGGLRREKEQRRQAGPDGPQEPAEAQPKNSLALSLSRCAPPSLRGQLVNPASLSYYGAAGQALPAADLAAGEAGAPRQEWREAGAAAASNCSSAPEPQYSWAVVQVQLGPQRKATLVFSPHNTDITLTDLHMQNCEATGIPPQLTQSL